MNKIKNKLIISLIIVLGLLLVPCASVVRAAIAYANGSEIVVYLSAPDIASLVTSYGTFFGEGVVDSNVFLSTDEFASRLKKPIFKSLFCCGHGVRLTSTNGQDDYSTGIPVGFIETTLGRLDKLDISNRPLAILYDDYFTSDSTLGKGNDKYVVNVRVNGIKDEDASKEAGIDDAIAKGEEIFGSDIKTITYGYYRHGGVEKANPAEAYILSHMDKNLVRNNYVQVAWWSVRAESGNSSGTSTDEGQEHPDGTIEINEYDPNKDEEENIYYQDEATASAGDALFKEAMAFQGYILEVAGASTGDEMKNRYNGQLFDIDYATKVSEIDTSDVDILYDSKTNTYRIGPMNINYIRAGAKYGDREAVDFAGISGAKLTVKDVDGSTREMRLDQSYYNGKKGFRIVYDHQRDMKYYDVNDYSHYVPTQNFYYPYPYPEENFYIEIDYAEDIASVEEFRFDFHWMNGGAEYENLLQTESYVIEWEVQAEYKKTTGHYDSGHYHGSGEDRTWVEHCHDHKHEYYDMDYNVYAQYKNHTTVPCQPFINCLYVMLANFNPLIGVDDSSVGGNKAVYATAGGWDLTTEIAGFAWVEGIKYDKGVVISKGDSKWTEEAGEQGQVDERKPNVEVRVMRVVYNKNGDSYTEVNRELAHAYKTKTVEGDGTVTLTDEYDWGNTRLYTNDNGEYKVYLKIPSVENKTENQVVSYDIEFIYDGQKYETVEYLVSTGKDNVKDKLAEFQKVSEDAKSTGTLDYSKYKNDSYVVESTSEDAKNTPVAGGRNEIPLGRPYFDSNYQEIYGDSPIDDSMKTNGKAKGKDGEKQLEYEGKLYSEYIKEIEDTSTVPDGEDRIVSTLVTDDDGLAREQYQLASRTSTASFLLPYTERIYIRHYNDKTATDDLKEYAQLTEYKGVKLDGEESWYFPVYEYFHQINLGLINREDVDVSVSKDLYKSEVIVNQQEVTYKYSTLRDYESKDNGEYLNTLLEMQSLNQKYELGLYAADFYYRSSVYEEAGTEVGQKIKEWKDGTELKMYVTYKMSVYNDSDTADVTINEIIDYHDSAFTLVNQDQTADVIDSEGHKYTKLVAEQPYYRVYSLMDSDLTKSIYHYNSEEDLAESNIKRTGRNVLTGKNTWNVSSETFGDGAYKKATLNMFGHSSNNEDFKLAPGDRIELFVTYEVDKEGYEKATEESYASATEATREKLLGGKNNIIEVGNYSSFYTDDSIRYNTTAYKAGDFAGKVDSDSAPDNVNFSKTEEDEDGDVTLDKKWFDDDADSAPIYKIYIREGEEERQIDGTVWEDKDSSDTGFDTATANGILDSGETKIDGVTVSLVEKIRITKDGSMSDSDTNPYLEYEFVWPDNISSVMQGYNPVTTTSGGGNYSFRNFTSGIYVVRFEYGNTEKTIKYNGQDYENTSYQTGMTNKDTHNDSEQENCDSLYQLGEPTLNNEWHDLGNNDKAKSLETERVSDARDYEPQRLRVIGYSRTINNSIAEVLAANDKGTLAENQDELIAGTAMVANTAKLNFEVERSSEIDYTKYNNDDQSIKVVKGVAKEEIENIEDTQAEPQKYYAKNIDFGIEERAQNSIQLDKYLKQIELTKQNGTELVLRAEVADDGNLEFDSNAALQDNGIVNMPQSNGVQGFKYITMESSYFDDLTVKLTYRLDVINESEVDFTSKTISELYTFEELNNLADEIEGTVDHSASTAEYTPISTGEGISYGEYAGYYYYTNEVIDGETKDATVPLENDSDITYNDAIVKTTVDKVIDYIDSDISIDNSSANGTEEGAWDSNFNYEGYDGTEKITTLDGLISDDSYTVFEGENGKEYLQDNQGNLYISESRSNIATSMNDAIEKKARPYIEYSRNGNGSRKVDSTGWDFQKTESTRDNAYSYKVNGGTAIKDSVFNRELTKELTPISYDGEENAKGQIFISTSVTVDSEESSDNMNYNNLGEVLIYSNTVGRRTFMEDNKDTESHETIKSPTDGNIPTIPGNANEIAKLDNENNTSEGGGIWNAGHSSNPSKVSVKLAEIDGDAPEYVTFTEPTGIEYIEAEKTKYMIIALSIMGVLSLGIVGITVKLVIDKRKLLGEK